MSMSIPEAPSCWVLLLFGKFCYVMMSWERLFLELKIALALEIALAQLVTLLVT